MNRLRVQGIVVIACLTLVMVSSACSTGTGGGPVTSAIDCKSIAHRVDVAVVMDASSKKQFEDSLPKTHEVEVCKGRQSILWFAEGGSGLSVALEQGKPGQGHAKTPMECFDVPSTTGRQPIASFCLLKTTISDVTGNIQYTVKVKTGKNEDVEIDPRLIIKE